MSQYSKHFTVDEARALLPELRSFFRDAHRRRHAAVAADNKLGELLRDHSQDLGGSKVNGMVYDFVQMNAAVRAIQDRGIVIKHFDRGLVDFPHMRDGEEVFLCWELDEPDIAFWHHIDEGYAGRERL
jgi:hypothetical protein